MPDSLLTVLGGPDGVDRLTTALYQRIATDPLLAATFARHDVFAIRQHMRDFMIAAVDGGSQDGAHLQRTHRALRITDPMFDATVGHVVAVLRELAVVGDASDEVRRLLTDLRPLIVSASAPPEVQAGAPGPAFDRFRQLTSIVAFWRAIAATHGGTVVVDPGFAAVDVRGRHAGGRGFVLDVEAVPRVVQHFVGRHPILWTRDAAVSHALAARGFRLIAGRSALTAQLSELPEPAGPPVTVVQDPAALFATDPDAVAELAGVDGITAYATASAGTGLAVFRTGTDAFVVHLEAASGPECDAALVGGLARQRAYGARTATYSVGKDHQERIQDLGFTVVDRWEAFV